jgi:hypothetical protein
VRFFARFVPVFVDSRFSLGENKLRPFAVVAKGALDSARPARLS